MSVGDVDIQGLCRAILPKIRQSYDEDCATQEGVSAGLHLAYLLVDAGGSISWSDHNIVEWRTKHLLANSDAIDDAISHAIQEIRCAAMSCPDVLSHGIELSTKECDDGMLSLEGRMVQRRRSSNPTDPDSIEAQLKKAENALRAGLAAVKALRQLTMGAGR